MLRDAQPVAVKDGGQEVPFSPTEMRNLAHGLLKERRRQRQQELGIIDAEAVPVAEDTQIKSQEEVADDEEAAADTDPRDESDTDQRVEGSSRSG
jgi:hypothetical protein